MRIVMTDQYPDPSDGSEVASNVAEFTVGEISNAIKRALETRFDRIRVRGEVGRTNYHGSGHLYFTLKDADAAMDAVAWRATAGRLSLRLEEGMEVICTGRISAYAKTSRYQIVVEAVELAGEGALLKLFEDRRRKLAAEGLFDPEGKQELPYLPATIGVVTSPTGAVIHDILHRLEDRFPTRVLLWPVPVQGDGAAAKIAAAIDGFNAFPEDGEVPRPDLLIVARGGGSLEDLWQFNEEAVVYAAAASSIPLISAIGHETDTTLIDFAADRRAPTPTAAAEIAVPVRAELHAAITETGRRLGAAASRLLEERRIRVEGLGRGLPRPERLFEGAMQSLDHETERLSSAMTRRLDHAASRLGTASAVLRDPRHLLERSGREIAEFERRLGAAVAALVREREARFCGLAPAARLERGVGNLLSGAANRLEAMDKLLESLSHERVLERGFALVRDAAENPVTAAAATHAGQEVALQFSDGAVAAVIAGPSGTKKRGTARRGRGKKAPSAVSLQRSLF